jgi:hypothetical protein
LSVALPQDLVVLRSPLMFLVRRPLRSRQPEVNNSSPDEIFGKFRVVVLQHADYFVLSFSPALAVLLEH